MTEKKGDGRTVQLKRVRLSFSSLDEKRATVEDGEPKHGFNVILEKDSPYYNENKRKVEAALAAAGLVAFKDEGRWKAVQEDNPKRVCYREGRRFKNKEGKIYDGYDGNWAVTCGTPKKGQQLPKKMIDRHKRAVSGKTDIADVFYNGVVCDVFLSFFGTDKGGQGFFNTCDAIRSWQEGDHMGGGILVDDSDFDDADDDEDDLMDEPSSKSKSSSDDDDLDLDISLDDD